ncbi:MAG TPA: SH3 domain-containing protein [Streptomyces sp.]|uniref:SH3 domain-containing protein n=1 Tax=Streptomyces sp. TaxID=1931 RepID=UPI002D4F2D48|nr:SH3 domain-containing protein [Streptomyces sp.]HZG06743.1 SH3 domain-containing protein [Streptomyces sp.]
MFKSKLSKLALCAAGGAAALATAAGPALAEPPAPVTDLGRPSVEAPANMTEGAPNTAEAAPATTDAVRTYLGRVLARNGLNVRAYPNTRSRVIRTLPYRSIIHIECKVRGQRVGGNPLWYKLDRHHHRHDGWVSARYVANIGPAPHFCHERHDDRNQERN